jgi:hypothetical protein
MNVSWYRRGSLATQTKVEFRQYLVLRKVCMEGYKWQEIDQFDLKESDPVEVKEI